MTLTVENAPLNHVVEETPHKVFGFGIGEENPAILYQEKDGKTGGCDRSAE